MQVSTTLVRHCIMTLYSIDIVLASVLFNSCICFIKKQPCERIAVGIKFTKPQTNTKEKTIALLLKPLLHTTAPSEKAKLKAPQNPVPIRNKYFPNKPITS